MGSGKALLMALTLVAVASGTGVSAGATAVRVSGKRLRYPLTCAGITVGRSTVRDVRRLYGDGFFVRNEGHGGGHYFVDPARQVTLHVVIGVDRVIESVSYGRGVRLPRAATAASTVAKATSTRLTPNKRLWPGYRLGERAGTMLRQFGKPKGDRRSGSRRVIRYETDHPTTPSVLFYEAELHFEKDRLVLVKLHNGC